MELDRNQIFGMMLGLSDPPTHWSMGAVPEVFIMAMHYPRRVSKRKRVRQFGFRARMKTRLGRKMINRKRRMKRRVTPSN
jgi:large subunit ribosomal protein L34